MNEIPAPGDLISIRSSNKINGVGISERAYYTGNRRRHLG